MVKEGVKGIQKQFRSMPDVAKKGLQYKEYIFINIGKRRNI